MLQFRQADCLIRSMFTPYCLPKVPTGNPGCTLREITVCTPDVSLDTMIDRRRDVLRIRVELNGILPPIWRELLVPAAYSFWDLHVAIQDSMGWLDYHLHEFRFRGPQRGNDVLIGIPSDESWENSPELQPGWEIPVTEYLSQPGDQAEYEYDFGDGWLHAVKLICVEPRLKGTRYPQCVAGERACPPEDCGGGLMAIRNSSRRCLTRRIRTTKR